MSHDSADTRVTAYIFGELSEDESKTFEQELAKSSQLRDEVAAMEEAVAAIRAELSAESTGVDDARRREIEHAIGVASITAPTIGDSWFVGGRRLMTLVALAASVLIVCGLVYTNLPEDQQLSMNDAGSRSPIAGESVAASDSMERSDATNYKVEDFSMKGGYDRGGETLLQEAQEEEEFARTSGRQLRRSSTAPAEDAPMAGRGLVAGKGGMKSDLGEALAKKPARSQAPVPTSPAPTSRALSEGTQLQAAPASPQGYAGGAYMYESAPQPVHDYSPPAAGEGESGQNRGVAAASQAPSSQLMPGQRSRNDDGAKAISDVEFTAPVTQGVTELELLVRPQVITLEREQDGIALTQSALRRRGRTSRGQRSEADMMGESEGIGEARVPQLAFGVEAAGQGGMAGGEELRTNMDAEMNIERSDMMHLGAGMAGDRYETIEDNPFTRVTVAPLSTFSVDVDTASYAKTRMHLLQLNTLPQPAAVRVEELLNYFRYHYKPPTDEHPFAATMDIAECPWNPGHRLARIGIKGKVIDDHRPPSNLVFLLDVSGSMKQPNKLPLMIEGMKMLTDQLSENDAVAIVVYAGAAGLVLDSTSGQQKQTITSALERLQAGGSTDGGSGIKLAYDVARDHFIVGGTNRVILCTDGDFNVGVTGTDELVAIAAENAKSNIYLSVLGFGIGNHNDEMMEKISNKGNGNYAFIDSEAEANKVLVEEMGGTLVTIAKDVKIQVEFNPQEIESYRLIGYENRVMAAQDFNDDTKDAGEIGAGHTVTALYELVPGGADSDVASPPVDDLRYQRKTRLSKQADSGEALTLKLRYKTPDAAPGDESTLIEFPVVDDGKKFSEMDDDFQFAASVASFGMLLRKSPHKGDSTYAAVEEIAAASAEDDSSGYRAEFLQMVARAKELSGESR